MQTLLVKIVKAMGREVALLVVPLATIYAIWRVATAWIPPAPEGMAFVLGCPWFVLMYLFAALLAGYNGIAVYVLCKLAIDGPCAPPPPEYD